LSSLSNPLLNLRENRHDPYKNASTSLSINTR
jgi:hypothetical protein